MSEKIETICGQIIRQLKGPMTRRNDSNLIVIKSQIESVLQNDVDDDEKIKLCNQILRQLDIPMRRSDDWNLGIVKEKVKALLQELKGDQMES